MTEELTEDLYCTNVNIISLYYPNTLFSNSTIKTYLRLYTEIVSLHSHYRSVLKEPLCFFSPSSMSVAQSSLSTRTECDLKKIYVTHPPLFYMNV
jgi:hypothetical protein